MLSTVNATTEKTMKATGIPANTCHISVFTNSTSENTSSNGSARTRLATELASSPASRRRPQYVVAIKP